MKKALVAGIIGMLVAVLASGCGGGSSLSQKAAGNASVGGSLPALSLPRAGAAYPDGVAYAQSAELAVAAAKLPVQTMVYRFVDANLDDAGAQSISSVVGVGGKASRDGRGWYFYHEGSRRLAIDPVSGKWNWIDEVRMWDQPPAVDGSIPSDADAVKAAEAELNRLGLLKGGLAFHSVTNATVSSLGTGEPGVPSDPDAKTISKQVTFTRTLAGFPVIGPSRVIVGIGEKGSVVGVIKATKDTTPYATMPLRPWSDALRQVLASDSQTDISSSAVSAELSDVQLALYEDPGDSSIQPYLQPVYVFHGVSILASGEAAPFVAVVPAMAD
ncbi:MAG: hypothetical protein M1325_00505 [Actinobacteria bacterium]|nr:hypothetical protein [Actinomycetota bacterium]